MHGGRSASHRTVVRAGHVRREQKTIEPPCRSRKNEPPSQETWVARTCTMERRQAPTFRPRVEPRLVARPMVHPSPTLPSGTAHQIVLDGIQFKRMLGRCSRCCVINVAAACWCGSDGRKHSHQGQAAPRRRADGLRDAQTSRSHINSHPQPRVIPLKANDAPRGGPSGAGVPASSRVRPTRIFAQTRSFD